jgi:hypothetical protein
MNLAEYRKWRQKTIVGISLRLVPHSGQYDPTKLINFGANRWAFKPELGYSHRWEHCMLDAYGGAWLYTTNPEFFSHNQFSPGTNTQTESPIGSFGGAPQLRFQAAAVGISRWQLLVRGHDEPKWSGKLEYSSEEFAPRRDRCDPFKRTSVNKI